MARDCVGKVVNTTERGLLVKAAFKVPIGSTLVDVRNQPVGRVADVLGPVSSPYLLVNAPKGSKPQRLLSREVYTP